MNLKLVGILFCIEKIKCETSKKHRRLYEILVCIVLPLVSLRSALILTCMNIRACPFSYGSMSVILWAFLNCKLCLLQKRRNHTTWWLLFSKVCNIVSEKRGVVGFTGSSESLHQGFYHIMHLSPCMAAVYFCKYKYVNST